MRRGLLILASFFVFWTWAALQCMFKLLGARHPVNKKIVIVSEARGGCLSQVEQFAHGLAVGIVHQSGVVEVAFALGRFLCQNVAVISVFSFDFACAGERETLFAGTVGLNLWHEF